MLTGENRWTRCTLGQYRRRELPNDYFGPRLTRLRLLVYARRRLQNLATFHVERPQVLSWKLVFFGRYSFILMPMEAVKNILMVKWGAQIFSWVEVYFDQTNRFSLFVYLYSNQTKLYYIFRRRHFFLRLIPHLISVIFLSNCTNSNIS